MAEIHNRLLVDVNAEVVDIITAVQEDTNSRYLDVVLYNNGVPVNLTGHEVRIYLRKPETGQEVWNNGEITDAVKGRCQFLMTTQALAEVGYLKAQISIWKDNTEILSTQIFNILVTESLRTTGSIESSNEYGALVVLFQKLYEAHALMTKMVESFGEAGKIATELAADTFWKMLEAVYQVNADALKNASVSEVLDRIGTTSDTGGTAAAGTAMAKLNELQKELNGIKKINSSADIRIESVYDTKGGTNKTLFSVSGSGNIHLIYFKPSQSSTAKIEINLDGKKTVFDLKDINTQKQTSFYISTLSMMFPQEYRANGGISIFPLRQIKEYPSYDITNFESSSLDFYYNDNYICLLTNPLHFDSLFEIKATYSYVGCGYYYSE